MSGSIDLRIGFAFIEYAEPDDCAEAIDKLNGADFLGVQLLVEPAKIRLNAQKGYRVIISNLDAHVSWQDLKDFARTAGNVLFANVFLNDGAKTGVIEYETMEMCEEAIRTLHDTTFSGTRVHLAMVSTFVSVCMVLM